MKKKKNKKNNIEFQSTNKSQTKVEVLKFSKNIQYKIF